MAQTKKTETVFLRTELNDDAKKFISDYLNSEPLQHHKVALAVDKLCRLADRVTVGKYNGQCQVNAFFVVGENKPHVCVGGLGVKPDLAWLSCYSKCEFVLDWTFENDGTADIPVNTPQFS